MTQVFSWPILLFSSLESLALREGRRRLQWQEDMDNSQWLELLRPCSALKDLYIDKKLAPRVALALKELEGERVIEELPELQSIFIEGLKPSGRVQESIGQFVAARQLFDHPVNVYRWDGRS
jgi:hypothetical protein